ncbi:MAG: carbamoyl-phosphate synthase large subunit [Nitrospirota bacterium]
MPKRTDISKILIIGSGPIVIGQACEFDYSGTQACKALREEGYKVILINNNPATIMTDPDMADATYIEPIRVDVIEKIIERERPDAILPTMGGQTALNITMSLEETGILDKYSIELIGARYEAIKKAENREEFKDAMNRIGLKLPESGYADNIGDAIKIAKKIGFPVIIRPSFTLGGTGGNVAYNIEELRDYIEWGLSASPTHEILVEYSLLGWKEFELEVMRDLKDNVVIVCSIENFDPMGVHTGDSITVAPAQTLTDKEYQMMRDASLKIIREIGVDTGGSNIQFAVNPENGDMIVIEMNPRVSRSSALASKATGFPIARIAAKLAIGYTLYEIRNDITRVTPVSFEPTIDYVVTKFPRFAFEKFPQADAVLTTQMKSVGEAMAIGRTFKESLQKAIRSLEIDQWGLESRFNEINASVRCEIEKKLRIPNWERIWYIADAIRLKMDIEEIYQYTGIDPWFLHQIKEIIEMEEIIKGEKWKTIDSGLLRHVKEYGFSDQRISKLTGIDEDDIAKARERKGIKPVYKRVDTCGAEFEAYTPYLYSTFETECESDPTSMKKVIILGGGPNRIGQGIEFDYCCVHAAFALKEDGYESIMVNCNPETVSTDYDTSDRLYFEPLTKEDLLNIIDVERPYGVVVQFGGQTPLKLALPLADKGVRILGTHPDSIDRAEDRERFSILLNRLNLKQTESRFARSLSEAANVAREISYPVMVRPSYVLGGRAMEIVYDETGLRDYIIHAVAASTKHPILIDKYLEDAIEIDVDAISDGERVVIGGIMEHIEEAGIHSGDSACSLPPYSLDKDIIEEIRRETIILARELDVIGLMNIQYAIKGGEVYILEVNPRASRTIPFVSKVIGVPLAKLAMKVMMGKRLDELGFVSERMVNYTAVKEAAFPFNKFSGVDTILGPEMKSTGEAMGIDSNFGRAFIKSQIGVGVSLPFSGETGTERLKVFISVKDKDKPVAVSIAKRLKILGFAIEATRGTADFLSRNGIEAKTVNKVLEGQPHIVDHLKNKEISIVINTVGSKVSQIDSYSLRRTALSLNIPYFTTISGAKAAVHGMETIKKEGMRIKSIQEYYKGRVNGLGSVKQ